MSFLDNIWLIPLFPLFGAAVMLLAGKKLDPQGPSRVAVADGVSDAHADHGHADHGSSGKFLISLLCPGMVLLSLIFSIGAVAELASKADKVHEVIKYTWLAGLPFHLADGSAAP